MTADSLVARIAELEKNQATLTGHIAEAKFWLSQFIGSEPTLRRVQAEPYLAPATIPGGWTITPLPQGYYQAERSGWRIIEPSLDKLHLALANINPARPRIDAVAFGGAL